MALGINGSLENREEDILQHFPEVWHKVLAPEDVTGQIIRLITFCLLVTDNGPCIRHNGVEYEVQKIAHKDVLNPGNLDHPLEVGRENTVLVEPASQLGPLSRVATIDGQAGLSILVFGILKITGHFL